MSPWFSFSLGILWLALAILKFTIASFPEYAKVRKWSLTEAWSVLLLGLIQLAAFYMQVKG